MNTAEYGPTPTGHFYLEVSRDGRVIEVMDEQNLIVIGSRETHARLLGGDVTNRSITQFACGVNGSTPVDGNTFITGQYLNAVTGVTYPAANKVAFGFALGTGENNGMAILEFGLLTAGGVLYARKVRAAALNKDSGISFTGTWTITFPTP